MVKSAAEKEGEVIRRRLMIDGDGSGDDRRLTALMKMYIKYCKLKSPDQQFHQKMMYYLAQSECSMKKSSLVCKMNVEQTKLYHKLKTEIDLLVVEAGKEIDEYKQDLEKAKKVRANREAYDLQASFALKQPDRLTTFKQIEHLKNELKSLGEEECNLAKKLELRKKQCHNLITSIKQMKNTLELETKSEEGEQVFRNDNMEL